MADVNIKYVCGCGFSTTHIDKAEAHVEKTGHTITSIVGTIKPKEA